jgi:hypothetical protein
MAYSVIVWLVNPGHQAHEEEETQRATVGRHNAPGAAIGVNIGQPFTRMVYGVYESQEEADRVLEGISSSLQQNSPLRVAASHAERVFLVPAGRVHYIVCEEVQRPKDRG